MPEGMVPRVVLVSDGRENKGSVARAIWQARQLGIPVDTLALSGRTQPALHLDSVIAPSLAFAGEKFPLDLTLSAPTRGQGAIEIYADGKLLGRNPIQLDAGDNRIRAHASVSASGATDVAVVVKTPNMGDARFDQAITFRRPKLLYISADPAAAETNLLDALSAAQFDIQRAGALGTRAWTNTRWLS